MAANHVYVFAKAPPSPITFLAEIRSAVEKGGKTISSMSIKMMARNTEKAQVRRFIASFRQIIKANIIHRS
jgi:DNA-directed RNA polymerase II subunit RPB2